MASTTPPSVVRENPSPWWLVPVGLLVVALVLIAVLAAFAATASPGGFGWMMGGGWGWGWMWGMGILVMALPVIVLVVLLAMLVRPPTPVPSAIPPSPYLDPASEVRMRYARGEITAEQYRETLDNLRRT